MTPEQQAKLFEEFSQANSSTARQLRRHRPRPCDHPQARAHDGRRCDGRRASRARARSSPSACPPARTRRPGPRPGSNGGRSARADCVLVIDDDATARELISDHLKAEGFSVVTAAGGVEGLKLAKELRPTVITLDVMMPDLDGWSVLTALRQDPELADIPVIMVTIVDEHRRGIALGAAGYLTKPIDRERLHRLVSRFRASAPPTRVLAGGGRCRSSASGCADGSRVRNGACGRRRMDARRWIVSEQDKPDVILLDLMMPEMDGFAVVAALQKEPRLAGHSGRRHHRARSRRQGPRAIELRRPICAGQGHVPTGRPGRAHSAASCRQAGSPVTARMEAAS